MKDERKNLLIPQGPVTYIEISSKEDARNAHNLMRRVTSPVEYGDFLEEVMSKLGKSVRPTSLGTGER